MNFYSNAEQIKPSVSSEKGEAISTPTTENFFLFISHYSRVEIPSVRSPRPSLSLDNNLQAYCFVLLDF